MNLDVAIEIAKSSRKNSYSPYSNYSVGCALVCNSGKIYSGCNIENNGIMSICAERVAFSKAISEGERDFNCIVVCGGPAFEDPNNSTPCGYCRQFMNEFVNENFKIFVINSTNNLEKYTIADLLPHSFNL